MREVPLSSFICMITVSVLVSLFMTPLSQPAFAEKAVTGKLNTTTTPNSSARQLSSTPRYIRPHATLGSHDEIATLEAIHHALSETADGETYVWRSPRGRLNAVLQPTTSFLDQHKNVCRHVVILLNSGFKSGRAEGIACRKQNGIWSLAG